MTTKNRALQLMTLTFLILPVTAAADDLTHEQAHIVPVSTRPSASCVSQEVAGCLTNRRFGEECKGKQACEIRKCREHAEDTCNTI